MKASAPLQRLDPTTGQWNEEHRVECPACGNWLFSAAGVGTRIEIACRCKRVVVVETNGSISTKERD